MLKHAQVAARGVALLIASLNSLAHNLLNSLGKEVDPEGER